METLNTNEAVLGMAGLALLLGSILAIVILYRHHGRHPVNPKQLTQRITRRAWTAGQTGSVAGTFVGLMLTLPLFALGVPEKYYMITQLLLVLLFAALMMMLIAHFSRVRGFTWADDFSMTRQRLGVLALVPVFYLAMMLPIGIVSALYTALLHELWGIEAGIQEAAWLIAESSSWTRAGYILLAIGVAPLYEELIFRGVLFPYLLKRMGLGLAISVVSLLFAAIHLHLQSAAAIYLLSAALCLAYWRTGSLWASIGLHAVFNGVSILILCTRGL